MAMAVIKSTIQNLDSLVVEKKEFVGLKNELCLILDFLMDSKLEEMNSLNYLISDVVEMALEAQALSEEESFSSYAVESIRSGLRETKERILLRLEGTLTKRDEDVPRRWSTDAGKGHEFKSHHPRGMEGDDDVVGLEGEVELLLREAIFNQPQNLYTSCIQGMGGIGKTTLARELYNHAAVVDRFEQRAWVYISPELSRKELLMKLIQQVVDCVGCGRNSLLEKMKRLDNGSLRQMLRQQLQGMRYFIVLDNVWEYTYLAYVLKVLPYGGNASRLLLTSRVGKQYTQYMHGMLRMDLDQSWELFLKTVFIDNKTSSHDHKFPKHMKKKVREMLVKCSGLPLAIKEVGTQLAKKKIPWSEWEDLQVSLDWRSTLAELELSYNKWSPKLKSCFLHLALFKEGTTIRAEKLVQVWTAGRVVSQEEGYQTYLNESIRESVVEVKGLSKNYRIKNCRINAILHKLSINKAKEEINFGINVIPHHRSHYYSRETFNHYYFTYQDKYLFSLFFHGGGKVIESSPSYWKRLELLRILDFEDFGLKSLPKSICILTRLRYLGLRNNYIQELPHTFRRLKNLEVLDLAVNFMVEIPNIIWEMDSLRHLYMSDIICRKPLRIDALKNLQTLIYISIDNWKYELSRLEIMTSIRKLGIEDLHVKSDVNRLFISLMKLKNLDSLILRGFRFQRMPWLNKIGVLHRLTQLKLEGYVSSLPTANCFPPNITYLTLVNTSLDEDPMPTLGKLSKLHYLKLKNAYTGHQMVFTNDGFLELRVLCIGELWHLRNVQVRKGAVRMLRRLEINNCPYLENLPKEMIANLQEFEMVTTKKIATKIRESCSISLIRHVDIQP